MKYKINQNLAGKKYGLLTVIKEVPAKTKSSKGTTIRRWLTKCACSKYHEVDQMHLTRATGGTRSCGCLGKRKGFKTKGIVHYRRLYNVWHSMLYRCNNPKSRDYHKYGARGIKVCVKWHKFNLFYNDVIDTYKPGLTIERVNVDRGYCKSNCTWIPNKDQAKNRRTTVWVEGLCAKDWCRLNGVRYAYFLKNKNLYPLDK